MKYTALMPLTSTGANITFFGFWPVTATHYQTQGGSSVHPIYDLDELQKQSELENTFNELKEQWHKDVEYISSLSDIISNRSYRAIIDLGPPVVPLIFRELEIEPDFWFAALEDILNVNPVSESELGDLHRMTDAWLDWGRENGYLD